MKLWGGFYVCSTDTLCVSGWTSPESFLQFAVQPPDQREHVPAAPAVSQLYCFHSCETTCAGSQPRGFESPWINAQTNFGKSNQVMGRAQQGAPESLCCSEFRTLLILQVCRAPYNTSGLRGKDEGWKGNYFLLQLSVLMTQIGEVCKLKEMPGWIWNWDQGYIFQWFLY